MRLTSRVALHPPSFTKQRHIRPCPAGLGFDPGVRARLIRRFADMHAGEERVASNPCLPTPLSLSAPRGLGWRPSHDGCLVSSPAPGAFLVLSVASCASRNPAEKGLSSLRFLLRIHRRRDLSDTALTAANSAPFSWTAWSTSNPASTELRLSVLSYCAGARRGEIGTRRHAVSIVASGRSKPPRERGRGIRAGS